MRHFIFIALGVITALTLDQMALGSTLNAGEPLQIRFSTMVPTCPGGPCDVLLLNPNMAGAFGATDVTASLFDHNSLLGTYFNPICCLPVFRSPSSLFQVGAAVDFTAINSGTID